MQPDLFLETIPPKQKEATFGVTTTALSNINW